MSRDGENLRVNFGHVVLGPILYAACHRLWLFLTTYTESDSIALFAARGGFRLLDLYRHFLSRQGLESPVACAPIMISRLTVSLAAWQRAPAVVIDNLLREFRGQPIETLAPILLSGMALEEVQEVVSAVSSTLRRKATNALTLYQLINGQSSFAETFRIHVSEQEKLFDEYLVKLVAGKKDLVICDTGLFGSTQLILMAAWPEYRWHGLYLGRSNYRRDAAPHFEVAHGLILERDKQTILSPETALLRHWHLVEMPLEPNLPSATHYFRNHGELCCNTEVNRWEERVESLDNPYYRGIKAYFQSLETPLNGSEIYQRRLVALRILRRKIFMPTLEDVRTLAVGPRSPDFGRSYTVPAVDFGKHQILDLLSVMRYALWKEGQIRIEFPRFGWIINSIVFCVRWVLLR